MRIVAIQFTSPDLMHPKGGNDESEQKTILEVARSIEKRYKLIEIFVSMYKDKFEKIIADEMARILKGKTVDAVKGTIQEKIKNDWRRFVQNQEHGIMTKAAMDREGTSFIETTAYYLSLQPKVIFE